MGLPSSVAITSSSGCPAVIPTAGTSTRLTARTIQRFQNHLAFFGFAIVDSACRCALDELGHAHAGRFLELAAVLLDASHQLPDPVRIFRGPLHLPEALHRFPEGPDG